MIDLEELEEQALALGVLELLRQRLVREILIPAPGAGVELSQTVPPSTWWELLAVTATLTNSAVVANRAPDLVVSDADGNVVGRTQPITTYPASALPRLTWSQQFASSYASTGNIASQPVPVGNLLPGWRVATSTQNIDVGDAWSAGVVVVREWRPDLVQANLDWIIKAMR